MHPKPLAAAAQSRQSLLLNAPDACRETSFFQLCSSIGRWIQVTHPRIRNVQQYDHVSTYSLSKGHSPRPPDLNKKNLVTDQKTFTLKTLGRVYDHYIIYL